jgi:hypothetical protein
MLPADLPGRAAMPAVVRGAVMVAAKKPGEGVVPLRQAYRAGCRDLLCLRWLAAASLAIENFAELDAVVAEWERLDNGNLEIETFRQAAQRHGKLTTAATKTWRVDAPASRTRRPWEPSTFAPRTQTPQN